MRTEIKKGYWATVCCCEDAFEIETDEEIKDILEEDELIYTIGESETELKERVCSCPEKVCKNITKLQSKK